MEEHILQVGDYIAWGPRIHQIESVTPKMAKFNNGIEAIFRTPNRGKYRVRGSGDAVLATKGDYERQVAADALKARKTMAIRAIASAATNNGAEELRRVSLQDLEAFVKIINQSNT